MRNALALEPSTGGGPRLLSRTVRLDETKTEHVLELTGDGFRLARARGAAPSRGRIASPVAVAAAPSAVCVECGEAVADDRAVCPLCTDHVHDGACSTNHASRHDGASGGRAYR